MRGLSSSEVLAAWEAGDAEGAVERALTLIEAGMGLARAEAVRLTIGERDALLLRLRELTFGPVVSASVDCPACGEPLELELGTALLLAHAPPVEAEIFELTAGDASVRFRLPDSADLAAAAAAADAASARRVLVDRCVLERAERGRPVETAELGDGVIAALAERMAELSPAADVTLDLSCPDCAARWSSDLDVAAFFWAEVRAAAHGLLAEVDTLARAYGWPESTILELRPERRRRYLELALA